MSYLEQVQRDQCPNGHGPLTIFNKPPAILYILPEDILDLSELEGTETPENMFGHLLGICQECGFFITTSPAYEYNYDIRKWEKRQDSSQEATEK